MQEEKSEQISIPNDPHPPRWRRFFALATFVALILFVSFIVWQGRAPEDFSKDSLVEIPHGANLRDIADILLSEHIIRSPALFIALVRHYGDERGVSSGTYLFDSPENILRIARRLAGGDHGITKVRITIPEGTPVADMAALFARALPAVTEEEFTANAKAKEGYLFPDTYFFFSTATTGEVIHALEKNFNGKTRTLADEAESTGKNWHEIVTLASIIEEEAMTREDRRIISGILSNRLESGMRLQVDAPFVYLIGKGSRELSAEDLNIDSPYNTYRNAGLPPTPISNPGADSLDAALHPSSTPYLYYLSDRDGVMHYARTFEEHKLNKAKYIR